MDKYNPDQLYSWHQHKETDEWHLFKTKSSIDSLTGAKKCYIIDTTSVCGNVVFNDTKKSTSASASCIKENTARMYAASSLKRSACGNCVANLYSSIED